jgi:hypothetical protein
MMAKGNVVPLHANIVSKHDKEFTWLLGELLLNSKGFYDYGLKRGLTTPEAVRLTVIKRQETAKALVDGGMSQRALLAQSDQNDWRTPRKFLEAAREVLGAIDLDPASGPEANETVKGAKFYTEAGRRPRRCGVDCRRAAHARGTRKGRAWRWTAEE